MRDCASFLTKSHLNRQLVPAEVEVPASVSSEESVPVLIRIQHIAHAMRLKPTRSNMFVANRLKIAAAEQRSIDITSARP